MKIIYGSSKKINNPNYLYLNPVDLIPLEADAIKISIPVIKEIKKKVVSNVDTPLFKNFDYSVWWFIYNYIFAKMSRTINFIYVFETLLEGKKPETIIVEGDFEKLDIIKQICKKNKILLKYSIFKYVQFLLRFRIINYIGKYRNNKIFIRKTRQRLGTFKSKNQKIPSVTNKVLFWIQTSYRRDSYDLEKMQYLRGEYIQGPLINILKKLNVDVVGIDIDYSFRGDLTTLLERMKEETMPWFPLEAILAEFSSEETCEFFKDYMKMLKDKRFRSQFVFNGVKFWNILEEDFLKLNYMPYLPNYVKIIESLDKFLKMNKPTAVFIPNETAILGLAMIIACRRNKIKTIGIEHGLIHHDLPRYVHDDYLSTNNPSGMPIPDFMLLFGNYEKKELSEKGTYPQDRLIVIGHPAYFEFNKIISNLKSQDPKAKYRIPRDKRIILFLTTRHQKYHIVNTFNKRDYDEQILSKLLELYSNNEKFFVILKPHPVGEYLESYKSMIDNCRARNFAIMQGDIFELLSICDIVISVNTTAFFDSVAFGKITIRVAFDSYNISIPLDKYGAIFVSNLDSLDYDVKRLSNINLSELKSNYDNLLKDQYNMPIENSIEKVGFILRKILSEDLRELH